MTTAGKTHSFRGSARAELFASVLLFGLMAVVARLASLGHGGFTGGQISVVRFSLGAALSLVLFRLRPGSFRFVNKRYLVTRGLLGGVAALLYFVALSRIPAGRATLLNYQSPILATLLAAVTLRERPNLHLAAGIVMTASGLFLVLGGGTMDLVFGWGELAAAASAFLSAGAVTSIRFLRATDNAQSIFFAFCLGGMAVSWPMALGPWPSAPSLWILALVAGVLSFGAQLLMTHAYGELTVPEAAVWMQLTPIASYAFAMIFLHEEVTSLGAVGVLLGLGGVVYATVFGIRTAGRNAAPSP
jgi:drug/metabolite transporter (DMT)-like permease